MNITISPAGRGRFDARLGDRTIVKATSTPFFDAARALLHEGVPPETPLTMAHRGDEHHGPCMSFTVGAAARLTVIENDRVGPRFAQYQPYRGPRG